MRYMQNKMKLSGNIKGCIPCAGKICLFVRNKADTIWEEGKTAAQLRKEIEADLRGQVKSNETVYFTSCRKKEGIDKLSAAIASALDGAKQERYYHDAKAYSEAFLDAKKKACERHVALAAGASAANALNPIPGVDIAVDITILLSLFDKLRSAFGLTDSVLQSEQGVGSLKPLASQLFGYLTREGIMLLLKRFAGQEVTKEVSKWIPFVGQAIAASIGFAVPNAVGRSYLDDCYALAKAILSRDLGLSRDS